MRFLNRKKKAEKPETSHKDIEQIAVKQLVVMSFLVSINRSLRQKQMLHETSRQLRSRANKHNKRMDQLKPWQKWLVEKLGLDWLADNYEQDIHFIAERFRLMGDDQSVMLENWHGEHVEYAAQALEGQAAVEGELSELEIQEYIQAAAIVRATRALIEPKAITSDNNENTASAT